jgi:hypothetical protein
MTSTVIGPRPPAEDDVTRATQRTAAVMADPGAGMAARLRAAEAEAAAITAYRHAGREPDVTRISDRTASRAARHNQQEATHEELEAGG